MTSGNFVSNDIYEFSYTAKNPTVNALGLAAIRDFNSFLRYASQDDMGTPNPLKGDVTRIYTETSSQPGRTLNDFVHLGFNQDENGMKVFDGMMQWIAAGDGLNMNYRWSQTKRTNRNRQELLYLEGLFPFANQTLTDPISGTTDGRYKKCSESNTCPLAMEFYSANEYWVKAGSLMSTDPMGKVDLPDHPQARVYLLSSKQHGGAGDPTSKGLCQQFLNPLDSAPVQRALWEDLDQWSTRNIAPPPSQVPKLSDGTLVPPLPQEKVGFPKIPGVTYTGLKTTRYRFNLGPDFYQTFIPTINPPVITPPYEDNPANGAIYPELRAEDRQRRQRYRRNSPAGIDGAAGDLHRMGIAIGRLGERRMRGLGAVHPLQGNSRRTHGRGRSASVRPGALSLVCDVSQRGHARDR